MEGSIILLLIFGAVICMFIVCFFLVIHFTRELIKAFVRNERSEEDQEETEFKYHQITRWIKIEHNNRVARVKLCYKRKKDISAKNPFGSRLYIKKDAELVIAEFKYN